MKLSWCLVAFNNKVMNQKGRYMDLCEWLVRVRSI